jgi:hypothetical protein
MESTGEKGERKWFHPPLLSKFTLVSISHHLEDPPWLEGAGEVAHGAPIAGMFSWEVHQVIMVDWLPTHRALPVSPKQSSGER